MTNAPAQIKHTKKQHTKNRDLGAICVVGCEKKANSLDLGPERVERVAISLGGAIAVLLFLLDEVLQFLDARLQQGRFVPNRLCALLPLTSKRQPGF
jgi:hypothetical protein